MFSFKTFFFTQDIFMPQLLSMSITAVVIIRNFQTQILPNDTLSDIAAAADPHGIVLGESYFWNSTGRLDHEVNGNPRRLLYFILSGVRYEAFAAARHYFSNTTSQDSLLMKMKVEIPSTSVANWLSLLTGIQAEISGFLGNTIPKDTRFDTSERFVVVVVVVVVVFVERCFGAVGDVANSLVGTVFDRAKGMKLKRGVAATTWLASFIQGALQPFEGVGIIGPDYTVDETVANPDTVKSRDDRRHAALLEALSDDTPYDLFLTQYVHPNSVAHKDGVIDSTTKSSRHVTLFPEILNQGIEFMKLSCNAVTWTQSSRL
jgi:hypothetical protein